MNICQPRAGHDFRPILVALLAWGNKHFAPEGPSVLLVNARTGSVVDPVLVDPATGHAIEEPEYALVPGPAAGERTRQKYANLVSASGKRELVSAASKVGVAKRRSK